MPTFALKVSNADQQNQIVSLLSSASVSFIQTGSGLAIKSDRNVEDLRKLVGVSSLALSEMTEKDLEEASPDVKAFASG